jgi:hypothetical protein
VKSLKQFYLFFIPGIIISTFSSLLLMEYLPDETYYLVGFYAIWSTYMPLFTFGFQDGMFLNYRDKDFFASSKMILYEFMFMFVFQFMIYLFLMFFVFGKLESEYIVYAFIAMLPINMLSVIRGILQSAGKTTLMAILDLVMRLTILLTVVVTILLGLDYQGYIYLDIATKFVLLILFSVYIIKLLFKFGDFDVIISMNDVFTRFKNNFSTGFMLLVGNLLLVFIFTMDRFFIGEQVDATVEVAVSTYQKAWVFLNMFIMLLAPIKTVLMSTIDRDMHEDKISNVTSLLLYVSIFICSIYMLVIYPLIIRFDILVDYHAAFYVLMYIMMIIPVMVNLQVHLINLLLLKFNKVFALINIFIFGVFAFGNYFIVEVIGNGVPNFTYVVGLLIFNFVFMFVIYSLILSCTIENLINISILLLWSALYYFATVTTFGLLLYVGYFILYSVYQYNKRFIYMNLIRGGELDV